MLLTDLNTVKALLEIDADNHNEDLKLMFFVEQSSNWIEEWLNRSLEYKSRTEYYRGTGSQKMLLRSRPVFTTPAIDVRIDETGYYGSASGSFGSETALTYGEHFALDIDQEDGTSRSGLLIRINNVWPKPSVRMRGLLSPFIERSYGTIKVTYTAGFTQDTLPSQIRFAANLLVAKMRYVWPLGLELGSESFQERSIGILAPQKDYMLALTKPMLLPYRNWKF